MNNDQPLPRMAMLKHDGATLLGVLHVVDSDHSLQVLDFNAAPDGQGGFAVMEMIVSERVIPFDATLDKWQELTPSDFWAAVRSILTKGHHADT